jgi:hypothetical protein
MLRLYILSHSSLCVVMISCDGFVHFAIPKRASNAILDSAEGLELWSLRDIGSRNG